MNIFLNFLIKFLFVEQKYIKKEIKKVKKALYTADDDLLFDSPPLTPTPPPPPPPPPQHTDRGETSTLMRLGENSMRQPLSEMLFGGSSDSDLSDSSGGSSLFGDSIGNNSLIRRRSTLLSTTPTTTSANSNCILLFSIYLGSSFNFFSLVRNFGKL